MPTLDAFIDSLTNEHDKVVQMGIIRSSKYQALFALGPKDMKGKGKQNNQKTNFNAPKPKEKNQQQDEPSSSKKNKNKGNQGKEKVKCSYCGKVFHHKHSYLKKKLDEMTLLLERNNINLPESVRKRDNHDRDIQPERGHYLKATVSNPRALLIEFGSSNHMVESKESFSSLESDISILIHMGDDS